MTVTLRDSSRNFGKIGVFTPYEELNAIVKKVQKLNELTLNEIVSSRGNYRFSAQLFVEYPDTKEKLGKGTGNMIVSNVFEKLSNLFSDASFNNSLKLIGRINNKRVWRYINKKFVKNNEYIDKYNVALPKSNGTGKLGEILSSPMILLPNEGATDTFISIGKFNSKDQANALLKYIKTKFLRSLLGVRKITQDNPRSAWTAIPMQDFTSNSDIDWSQSIADIDQQLYRKYGLSNNEINFIETKVQAMEE